MAEYKKKTWADDEVITADDLNNMETGILEAKKAAEQASLKTQHAVNADKATNATNANLATQADLLKLDWETLGTPVYNIYDVDWEYTNGEDEENLGQNIWSISGTPRDMSYIDLTNITLASGLYVFAIFEKVDLDTTEIVANDMHKATFLMYVQNTGWDDRWQGVSTARGGGSYFEIEESEFYAWSDYAIESAPYIDEDPNDYAEYHDMVTCLRLYDKNGNNITKGIDMDSVWLYYARIA